jgi:3,4-dihydroxyphenylacetate 2,3-dioxygenase
MGEVVAAIFTTHVPRLMITDLTARKAYMGKNVTTFYDAMPQLERERLRDLEFDTFVLIDTHWFTTLEYILNAHERLAGVYTSEELPQMLHDLEYDYRGDPELANAIALSAQSRKMRGRIGGAKSSAALSHPQRDVLFQSRSTPPGALDERVPDRLGAK